MLLQLSEDMKSILSSALCSHRSYLQVCSDEHRILPSDIDRRGSVQDVSQEEMALDLLQEPGEVLTNKTK